MIVPVTVVVFINVHIVQKRLAVLDPGKTVGRTDIMGPAGLDLSTDQGDTGLDFLENLKIVKRLSIFGQFFHKASIFAKNKCRIDTIVSGEDHCLNYTACQAKNNSPRTVTAMNAVIPIGIVLRRARQ